MEIQIELRCKTQVRRPNILKSEKVRNLGIPQDKPIRPTYIVSLVRLFLVLQAHEGKESSPAPVNHVAMATHECSFWHTSVHISDLSEI